MMQGRIPMYEPGWSLRCLGGQYKETLDRVLAGSSAGSVLNGFEAAFSQFVGVSHTVATASGTGALKIALLALGIGRGDEVIIPAYTCIATAAAVVHAGATPVLADIDPVTLNVSPEAVEAVVGGRTRAIIPVHLFGRPAPMPQLSAISERHGLAIVEDACLALGARVDSQPVGRWGRITCFSFAPTKHLGAISSGGAAVTADPILADRMRRLAAAGRARGAPSGARIRDPQVYSELGLNETLSELEASVLWAKLPFLPAWELQRRTHADTYRNALVDLPFQCPAEEPGMHHTYRNFVIQTDLRPALLDRLHHENIEVGVPYVPPLHLQPPLGMLGYGVGAFPVAEAVACSVLSLPVGPELRPLDQERVIAVLRKSVLPS